MIPVGPIALALNTPVTEDDPAQQGGPQSVAVQIQNSSPFVINVLTVGDAYTIQPRIAQTVPVSGQPIVITAEQQLAGGSPNITIVWLLQGEAPPMADGPLPSPSTVLPISGNVDVLAQFAALDLSTPGTLSLGHALNPYETIVVALANVPQPTNPGFLCPAFRVRDAGAPGTRALSQWQTQNWQPRTNPMTDFTAGPPGPFYLPANIPTADPMSLDYADAEMINGGTGPSIWDGTVYGLGAAFCPYPLRPDGRMGATGALVSEFTAIASSSTNLAEATSEEISLLVQTVEVWSVFATAPAGIVSAAIHGVLIGSPITLATVMVQHDGTITVTKARIPDNGLLLDPGTNVTLDVISDGTTPLSGSVTWDLVL